MATPRVYTNSLVRIEQLCASVTDARALRIEALDEIRKVVAFDSYVWLMTDPATAVGADPLAEVPSRGELPETIRLKYLTEVNRWTALAASGTAVGLLHNHTGGDLSASLMWREMLSRYGVGDVASVVFADRFGIWGFLDLWRQGGAPFTETEGDFLSAVAPPLSHASRACQAFTFTSRSTAARRDLGPVVFLLDEGLEVVRQTPASQAWLEILLPPPPGLQAVPASVYNTAGQLVASEGGVDGNPPRARVHLAHGFWVTLRAARLSRPEPAGGATIVVTMEETSAEDRLDVFARAFGLTRRETELMSLLAGGGDTRGLARAMYISEYTVQDHLKAIFAKTGAANRQTLLTRALGR